MQIRNRLWQCTYMFLMVPCLYGDQPDEKLRQTAERVKNLRGLENVGRVAEGIYRGAQPTAEGLNTLKTMGVKTVINLRHYHGSKEETWCRERGMEYVRIVTETSDAPRDEDVRRFLEVVTDPKRQPVYFHCRYGKDRTGTMCALYRMAVEGWKLEEALLEMDDFGFRRIWKDLRRYVTDFPQRHDPVWPIRRPAEKQ